MENETEAARSPQHEEQYQASSSPTKPGLCAGGELQCPALPVALRVIGPSGTIELLDFSSELHHHPPYLSLPASGVKDRCVSRLFHLNFTCPFNTSKLIRCLYAQNQDSNRFRRRVRFPLTSCRANRRYPRPPRTWCWTLRSCRPSLRTPSGTGSRTGYRKTRLSSTPLLG